MTRQSVHDLISAAAQRAQFGVVHLHMLRHPWGFSLAKQG